MGGAPAHGRRPWPRREAAELGHANSYVLQVIQTSFLSLGGRNQRELLTLAEALDRMASGDYDRAADVLSQRFKAIEMALHDGEWSRASHVEILPQTGRPLLSRQEEALVARDIREEVRIKAHLDKAGVVAGRGAAGVRTGSPLDRQPADKTKDKGRGKHGKGQQGGQEERCVGVCVGPRPGRKTTPADHDGRQELGRLRLRAHVDLSCTWSSRVGGGGGHP